jgi:FkbM family methyltransferase
MLSKFKKLWWMFFPPVQQKRVRPWIIADGDSTFRLDYNELNENSVVIDLGGYKGQWAGEIFSKYMCTVYVFEPALSFYKFIMNRYKRNSKIRVFGFGLGAKNEELKLFLQADSTSLHKQSGESETILIRNFSEFMNENKIEFIDLIKINIEGAEYDLLDYIIDKGEVKKIKNIQVQFHDFVPNAESRMKRIQKALSYTHECTYSFEFVWENWKLKN